MAIVFVENSEHGNAPTSAYVWDSITGAPAINSGSPIKGTYDIRVGRGDYNTDYMRLLDAGHLGTTTIAYLHFWYKLVTAPSAGNVERVCGIIATPGSGVLLLVVDEYARLVMGANFQLVIGQPVEVEFYAEVVPGTKTVHYAYWVNGTLIKAADSVFALNETAILSVIIGGESAAASKFNFDAYYDDIVVDTERRIGTGLTLETEVPNADDGTEDEWSPNDSANPADNTYDHVKDIPTGVGSYAWCLPGSSDATTQEQLWAFPATTATGTVIAVDCLFNSAWLAGGSVRSFYHRIKLPSTGTVVNTDISTLINATTVPPFIYYRTCCATDPDGAAWTKASADALLVGGQRGADANAYTWRIYDVYKTVVYRDTPQDWAGII